MVALFNMIDSIVGSSKPVVKILTDVMIAFGVFLNHLRIKSRSFFVFVLSKCAIGYPALLKAWKTWIEVWIPLLKINVFLPLDVSSYALTSFDNMSTLVYKSSEDFTV